MCNAVFSSMADCYVASVRRGDVPCVESVLRTTAERENMRAVERSVAVYERLMSERLDASPADSVQAFIDAHDRSEREATTTFAGLVVFDTDRSSREQLDVRATDTHHVLSLLDLCIIGRRHLHLLIIILLSTFGTH